MTKTLTKNLTTTLTAGVLAVALLAGCGGGDSGESESSAPATTAKPAANTLAGCVQTLKALGEDIPEDKVPAACDDLSQKEQAQAFQLVISEALGNLKTELDKLDPETRKEVDDALKGVS